MNLSVRKQAIIVLLFFALLLFLAPQPAHAALGIPSMADIVTGVFRIIAFVFNFFGGILFTLAGMLVNLMLSLNLSVLDKSNTLVHVGWRIVRDLANLGFVLVIIVIAFATILRFEQYGVTKLLPKLIGAAIIVNFSFTIAATFINFTHVLTNFFASKALPESTLGGLSGWDLSASLSNAFGPQRFFIESDPSPPNPEEEAGALTEFGTAVLTSITGLIFTLVFTLLAAFVLLAFAFMLLLRYLYLTFLVILAPLVWLFWVIPALEGQFKNWWNKFFQWSFFAPAVMFFIYLALVSLEGISKMEIELKNTGGFFTGVLQNTMIQGAQMVVLSGILIGGLIIAQKMGITGAAGAMGIATKVGTATKGWTGRQALKGATLPLRTDRGQKLVGKMQTLGQNRGFLLKTLSAPIRQMGGGLATASRKGEALVKAEQEKIKGMSYDQKAKRYAAAPNEGKVAILKDFAAEAVSLSKEKKAAQRRESRAQKQVNNAQNRLTAATATGNDIEIARARQAHQTAINELQDAIDNRQKVIEKRMKFKVALDMLPIDARNALIRANYDLSKLKVPKKIFRKVIIETPLARRYGERGEYKGEESKT